MELEQAIMNADLAKVQQLLASGADAKASSRGFPVLFRAVQLGSVDVVKALLDAGADPNTPRGGMFTATPLFFAAAAKEDAGLPIVRLLIEKGADVNHRDNFGDTALFPAAASGSAGVIEVLLEAGVDPKIANNRGKTAGDDTRFAFIKQLLRRETIPKADTLYDVSMAAEAPVAEFVEEHGQDGVVFHYANQAIGHLRSALRAGWQDGTAIFYECKGKKGLAVSPDDVVDAPYYNLTTTFSAYIPISEFEGLLNSRHVHWKLTKGKELPYTASRASISGDGNLNLDGQPLNLVSADHCQEGTKKDVFSLTAVVPTGGRRKIKRTRKQWKRSGRSLKKARRTFRRTLRKH